MTERQRERDREKEKETDRQTDRKTDRKTDRQRERLIDLHRQSGGIEKERDIERSKQTFRERINRLTYFERDIWRYMEKNVCKNDSTSVLTHLLTVRRFSSIVHHAWHS